MPTQLYEVNEVKITASVFVLGCWIVVHKSAIKPNSSCWGHICCQYYLFPRLRNVFAKRCAAFPRKQQVAAVDIPVTRSLSGPITAWSPSAVNSMLSLWELMSRFRVCPWASFGPATTTTTTTIPEGGAGKNTWKKLNHQNVCFIFLLYCLHLQGLGDLMRHIHSLLGKNLSLLTHSTMVATKVSKQPPTEKEKSNKSEVISLHPSLHRCSQPCKEQI